MISRRVSARRGNLFGWHREHFGCPQSNSLVLNCLALPHLLVCLLILIPDLSDSCFKVIDLIHGGEAKNLTLPAVLAGHAPRMADSREENI